MTRGYHSHLHVAHLPRKPAIIEPVSGEAVTLINSRPGRTRPPMRRIDHETEG